MTSNHRSTISSFFTVALLKRMLVGAAIGLTLMIIFLSGVPDPEPEWGRYWTVRPLIVIAFAGAAGGAFFHLVDPLRFSGTWKKIAAFLLCLLVFVFCLWIGSVLGLDGTLWD
ncbi:hypothetical protein [Chitinophaga caseinilytica]|uniref:Potassium transporter KefB n=1 Tax=Chitinophaga caseinilytica TaxID=2267521 RepID=A0ABZ2Z624_9BACT